MGDGDEELPAMPTWSGVYDAQGLPHGVGTLKYPAKAPAEDTDGAETAEETYVGAMEHGRRCGRGTYSWRNGSVYSGHYKDNIRCGQGVMKYPDGSSYEGAWVNNKYHGFGTYTYKNGDKYQGSWRDGVREGEGSLWFKATESQYQGRFFYGEFIEGTWMMKDGCRREGKFTQKQVNTANKVQSEPHTFTSSTMNLVQSGIASPSGWHPLTALAHTPRLAI